MAEIDARRREIGQCQRVSQQTDDFDVGLNAGVTIEFGSDLQRLARCGQAVGTRMQHIGAVAQARDTSAIEQVCVDARHLRRDVGAHAHHASRELVDHLEGAQLHVMAGAGEQRVHVFQQRRHDQLVLPAGEQVEDPAPQRRAGARQVDAILVAHRAIEADERADACVARRRRERGSYRADAPRADGDVPRVRALRRGTPGTKIGR